MTIYLPIAEMSASVLLLLGLGAGVGFLSGMFGVGGGFLMTPLLIFIGVPPAVAVGTEASQIAASSVSGAIAQWRRKAVDLKMGAVLTVGGLAGSAAGVQIFAALRAVGQIDVVIAVSYVLFLGAVGALMLVEALQTMKMLPRLRGRARAAPHHSWIHGLPLRTRFPRSKLYISAVPPLIIGFGVGVLAAIMGVGGGFLMVPAMIYLLRMPTNVVIGTSLFQITFVTSFTTVLHASLNQTVDIVLGLLLLAGGVVGAQFGVRAGQRLKAEQLRALLAALVLLVCARIGYDLVVEPRDPFILQEAE